VSAAPRHSLWVVDDVALEREASRIALAPNYDVEVFSDGSAVLERAATGRLPDLLVLDWHMAGVGGLEVVRFLRASPRTVGLPILVFTATGDKSDLLEALEAGADDYVGKGSSNAELSARVASLIRSKGVRERAERAERDLAILLEREREARADAEAANRAKDQFLATVSHELRTPLNAILGWARILKSGKMDGAKVERAIATIERNAIAQAQIIEDLLDVSRIVSGKLRLELSTIEIADVVEQAIESARPAAAAKRIRIDAAVECGCSVAGDPARLQQIVWNLLTNAVKFTPAEGVIEVELATRGEECIIRVSDTGRGIATEVLPHIFDRFRQGDSTTTRSQGGLGLGLAIVRQLVEAHGGRVEAKSAGLGKGATFEVTLPALAALGVRGAHRASAGSADVIDLLGVSILVVEDEADARELVKDLLVSRGATVLEAASAAQALATLEVHTPDLIVSDIAMPEKDGYSLMREIRGRPQERAGWIPAIAVTALAREEDRWEALAAGFQAHVAKPIDPSELAKAVARLCQRDRDVRGPVD
jgi:signal transduction histidine kinase